MIIDVTGTVLIPGNGGEDCPGNGNHHNTEGIVECCCEECDYRLCCLRNARSFFTITYYLPKLTSQRIVKSEKVKKSTNLCRDLSILAES